MTREITGGWKAYVNPVLVLKPLPCEGETDDGESCSFNGRFLCYNADLVAELYNSEGAFPTALAFCRDHLPERYENADDDDALTVVDTKTVACEATKNVDDPDRISPMELQGSFSSVNIEQKAERSAFYECSHTALIRLFDDQGGYKDVCGKHARDSWLSAIEDPEDQAEADADEVEA